VLKRDVKLQLTNLSLIGISYSCGQTVGWTKMSLGRVVSLGPGHIVLDGDPVGIQPPTAAPPHFRPMPTVTKRSPISATAELLLIYVAHLLCSVFTKQTGPYPRHDARYQQKRTVITQCCGSFDVKCAIRRDRVPPSLPASAASSLFQDRRVLVWKYVHGLAPAHIYQSSPSQTKSFQDVHGYHRRI